jgi:hypothetical protein
MSSKLETFLKDKKIDTRKLLSVSHELESLRDEDRALRHAKKSGKKAEGDAKKAVPTGKPRSGRPVTQVALDKIFAGKPVNGPTRTRVLRAVNAILETRKQDKVDLGSIFDLAKTA